MAIIIVAIGASAGALEGVSELMAALPSTTERDERVPGGGKPAQARYRSPRKTVVWANSSVSLPLPATTCGR